MKNRRIPAPLVQHLIVVPDRQLQVRSGASSAPLPIPPEYNQFLSWMSRLNVAGLRTCSIVVMPLRNGRSRSSRLAGCIGRILLSQLSPLEYLKRRFCFPVLLMLKYDLRGFGFTPSCRQFFLCDFHLLSPIQFTIFLTQLFRKNAEFTLTASNKLVVGAFTLPPPTVNIGIAGAYIEWIKTHRDLCVLNFCIKHYGAPVVKVIHSHTSTRMHRYFPRPSTWISRSNEVLIIRNLFVSPFPIAFHALLIGLTWPLPMQCRVGYGIIILEGPLLHMLSECFERPYRMTFGISCLRPKASFLCRLCVA